MSEKKIFSIDVAMDEPMYRAIHGLAEADGVSASELMRMLASTLIEERATYYARLHSIFGQDDPAFNEQRAGAQQETKPVGPPNQIFNKYPSPIPLLYKASQAHVHL